MFKDVQATIEIDLKKSIDKLWTELNKDARWGIKKARKSDLKINNSSNLFGWDEFYKIYIETITRGGIIPKEKDILQKEIDNLFLCFMDKKIIAGAAIKIKNNKIELFLNASKQEFLKFQPNNLLYWSIIEWGKKKGYSIFDLGGYQLGAKKGDKLYDVNRFKERWGGKIRKYTIYSKNPFYILGRKIIRNISFIKKLRDNLKLWQYKFKEIIKKSIRYFKFFFRKFIYDQKEIILFSKDLNCVEELPSKTEAKFEIGKKEHINLIKNNFSKKKLFNKRLEKGKDFFIYILGKDIVHYSWVTYDKMEISEISLKIPLKKEEICIFDCYTPIEKRGNNLYPSMLTKIMTYFSNKGFTKCYIYVDFKNSPSIRGIKKAGFLKDKKIKYTNFLMMRKQEIFD
jgi:hypothetical protein